LKAESLARSLVRNLNTNDNEQFFAGVNKLNMGKRTHLAGRGSFERRAKMYGIQASEGYKWHLSAMKTHSIRTANVTEEFCRKRDDALSYLREYRLKNPKRRKVKSQKRDMFYGNLPVDLSPEELHQKIQATVEKVKLLPDAITDIEIRTRGAMPHILSRLLRGRIHCNLMSDLLNCVSDEKEMEKLILKIHTNKYYTNDNINEKAKSHIELKLGAIVPCGLYIDKATNCMCCQPQGIIEKQKALVEFCNRVTQVNFQERLTVTGDVSETQIFPRLNSSLYHKLQIQLHITGFDICYVVVPYKQTFNIIGILKNPLYWERMKDVFETLYLQHVLPEALTNKLQFKFTLAKVLKQREIKRSINQRIIRKHRKTNVK
jgi:hypothetical protein